MQYADVPDLRVEGFDIDDEALEMARSATYTAREVAYYGTIPHACRPWVVVREGHYTVAESIRSRAHFAYGNILDPWPRLAPESADLILCQNVLVHLQRKLQEAALANLYSLAKPGGLVLVGGTDLDVIESMTVRLGLQAVFENCREIHEAWADRRAVWNDPPEGMRPHYALEPFGLEDRRLRYVSVFRK
jgi:chemotaxis methyl-accepting protein methylase